MKVGDKIRILDANALDLSWSNFKNGDVVEIDRVNENSNGVIKGTSWVIYHGIPYAWEIVDEKKEAERFLGTPIESNTKEMTTEEYFEFIDNLCEEMKTLVRAKNADYTAGVSPFANFKASEKFGVDALVGLSVRIGDKIQRLQSYCLKGNLEVKGEGVDEVFRDLCGYSWLGLGMLEERRRNEEEYSIQLEEEKK